MSSPPRSGARVPLYRRPSTVGVICRAKVTKLQHGTTSLLRMPHSPLHPLTTPAALLLTLRPTGPREAPLLPGTSPSLPQTTQRPPTPTTPNAQRGFEASNAHSQRPNALFPTSNAQKIFFAASRHPSPNALLLVARGPVCVSGGPRRSVARPWAAVEGAAAR